MQSASSGLAVPFNTRNPQDFARPNLEIHAFERSSSSRARNSQAGKTQHGVLPRPARELGRSCKIVAARDHGPQSVCVNLTPRHAAANPASREDRDSVGDLYHLGQLVRYEHYRLAVPTQ